MILSNESSVNRARCKFVLIDTPGSGTNCIPLENSIV